MLENTNGLRVYDLVVANLTQETKFNKQINTFKSIYEASNLGGGYSRSETGDMAMKNEQISFTLLFVTDAEKTGYEKYLETVTDISQHEMVWLRYGVPVKGGYTYAYRPGYVSGITKREATFDKKSFYETITIDTIDSWFRLYQFSQSMASETLNPAKAMNVGDLRLFSDDYKQPPYHFPYFYRSVIEEHIRRLNGTNPDKSTWFQKWGNVLDSDSDVYTIFAVHAPNTSVSELEKVALASMYNNEPSGLQVQINRKKAPGWAEDKPSDDNYKKYKNDVDRVVGALSIFKTARNNVNGKRQKVKHSKFKASLANYSDDSISAYGPFHGSYTSYQLIGNAQAGGKIQFNSSAGVELSSFKFNIGGYVVIDTASWANIYKVNGGSAGIDFSHFVTTGADQEGHIECTNVTLDTIIMRRNIITI